MPSFNSHTDVLNDFFLKLRYGKQLHEEDARKDPRLGIVPDQVITVPHSLSITIPVAYTLQEPHILEIPADTDQITQKTSVLLPGQTGYSIAILIGKIYQQITLSSCYIIQDMCEDEGTLVYLEEGKHFVWSKIKTLRDYTYQLNDNSLLYFPALDILHSGNVLVLEFKQAELLSEKQPSKHINY